MTDHFEDVFVPPGRYEMAKKLMPLLQSSKTEPEPSVDPEDANLADMSKNNMLNLLYYFEQAGVGLPRLEMFAMTLSIRKLIRTEPIISIRSACKYIPLP